MLFSTKRKIQRYDFFANFIDRAEFTLFTEAWIALCTVHLVMFWIAATISAIGTIVKGPNLPITIGKMWYISTEAIVVRKGPQDTVYLTLCPTTLRPFSIWAWLICTIFALVQCWDYRWGLISLCSMSAQSNNEGPQSVLTAFIVAYKLRRKTR